MVETEPVAALSEACSVTGYLPQCDLNAVPTETVDVEIPIKRSVDTPA